MTTYREKLASLGWSVHRGGSETKRITDERDGSVAGLQTENWDGSVDAQARPKPIKVKAKLLVEEET